MTWQDIRQHISERLEVKRQYGISDVLHKTPGRSSMHALAEPTADKDADTPPPPTMSKMAALEAKMERMQAAFNRSPKGGGKGVGKARGRGGGLKFNFRGCWECGEEGHSQWECKHWTSILDSDGQPPKGQGKKDKAYASWKANKAKAEAAGKGTSRKKVNALLGSQSEAEYTEDEDDDDEENTKLMIEQCSENGDGYSAIVSIAANPLDFCVKCYENDDHNDLDSSSPAIFDIHDLSVVNNSQVNDDKTDLIYSQLQPQSTLPTLETYALSAWSQNHCGEEAGSLKPTQIRATQIDSQLSQTQPTQEMETAEYN